MSAKKRSDESEKLLAVFKTEGTKKIREQIGKYIHQLKNGRSHSVQFHLLHCPHHPKSQFYIISSLVTCSCFGGWKKLVYWYWKNDIMRVMFFSIFFYRFYSRNDSAFKGQANTECQTWKRYKRGKEICKVLAWQGKGGQ